MLSLEHVEEFVFVAVDVKRCVRERRNLLEERECSCGCGGRDAHEDRDVAE